MSVFCVIREAAEPAECCWQEGKFPAGIIPAPCPSRGCQLHLCVASLAISAWILLFPVPDPRGILRIPSFPAAEFKTEPCVLGLGLEKEIWSGFACFPFFFFFAWNSPQCCV